MVVVVMVAVRVVVAAVLVAVVAIIIFLPVLLLPPPKHFRPFSSWDQALYRAPRLPIIDDWTSCHCRLA